MRLNDLLAYGFAAYSLASIASYSIISRTSPAPNMGILYHSELEAKSDIGAIKVDLGLDEVEIDIVFRGTPKTDKIIPDTNTFATRIGDKKWIIQLSEGYRTKDALEHEAYHVFASETRKFPFTNYPKLRALSLMGFYEQWRANRYALTAEK